ncbi:MAG: hypothetical protein IJ774_02210 [Selenomonadaceae bacterium]|nr:hypothetical protein [Selenomonadaceae bacterium]
MIHKDEKMLIRTSKSYRYREVAPESISQLVGRDCDGAEVYEGDMLEDTLIGMYISEKIPSLKLSRVSLPSNFQISRTRHKRRTRLRKLLS